MEKKKKSSDFISEGEQITDKYEAIYNGEKVIAKDNEECYDNTHSGSLVPIRIKELRKQYKLRQADLAAVLQCSTREYWRYEQQGYNTNYMKLLRIASFYNVSLDYIFGVIDEQRKLYPNQDIEAEHFDIKKYPLARIEK